MLSKRLETVASLITTDSIIDVGCDHGYLDIYLTKKGIKCLATDISNNALNAALTNFKKYNLDIPTICTDGLNNIAIKDTDTIVIAGLGTDSIIKILNKSITNDLVILTHNHLERLRRYVVSLGYYIDKEVFVIDNNKPYIVIKFKYGKCNYNTYDYIIGPTIKDIDYFNYLLNKYTKILNGIPSKYKNRIDYYNSLIKEIEMCKESVK